MEKIKSALQLTLETEGWQFLTNLDRDDFDPLKLRELGLVSKNVYGRKSVEIYLKGMYKEVKIEEKAFNIAAKPLPDMYAVYVKR